MEGFIIKEKSLKRNSIWIIIIVNLIIAVIITTWYSYNYLKYDKIYSNIYINDINIGDKTKEEAIKILEEAYTHKYVAGEITFQKDDMIETEKVSNLIPELNFKETVEKAYNTGREGNAMQNIINGFKNSFAKIKVPVIHKYDEYKITQIVEKFGGNIEDRATQTTYEIEDDKLILKIGKQGYNIDTKKLEEDIDNQAKQFEFGAINVNITMENPKYFTVEELYNEVCTKPIDATYRVEDNKLIIEKEKVGIDFDKEKYREKVNNLGELQQYEIKLNLTSPKTTEKTINDILFNEKLGTYSTKYNTGDVNRSSNIKLASEKINNLILNPGEEFSYNNIVGERTAQAGFKKAHVYSNGRIIDDYGGGICQVSSTLYNAVLLADLEIISRTNHIFTVGYVPLSQDATVSYGTVDFKFKNNMQNPIKIRIKNESGKITVEIYGKKEDPDRTIQIINSTLLVIPIKETVIEDIEKTPGYKKTTQTGQTGYKSQAYKIIKENGVEIERILLSTDTYASLDKVTVVGKKEENIQQEEPIVPNTPPTQYKPTIPTEQIPDDQPTIPVQQVPAQNTTETQTETQQQEEQQTNPVTPITEEQPNTETKPEEEQLPEEPITEEAVEAFSPLEEEQNESQTTEGVEVNE